MKYYATIDPAQRMDSGNQHYSYPLLDAQHGCTNDCMTGISVYASTEYTPVAVHSFQEGFIVLDGDGFAQVGDETFPLYPKLSFIVPSGVTHALKSASNTKPVTLFWFHAKA